ncbi:MAG: SecDF P1 head subdomain-containing protein [Solirubrobacteraceae bacterium]
MSDYFDRVERQIVRNVEAGPPRSSRLPAAFGYLASAAAVLVVIIVAGVFLLLHGSSQAPAPASSGRSTVTIRFTASTIAPHAPLGPAIDRAVVILTERLGSAFPGVSVSRAGNGITVSAPNATANTRAILLALAGTTTQLAFYDWEANVITPNGKTVASQLQTQDPTATEISQGNANKAPGQPGAGSMNLYDAVKLASKQPESSSRANSRHGPQYYVFGAPGSAACQAAAKANGTTTTVGEHCLLSGPDDNESDLLSGLPAGLNPSEGEIVTVPRGTVVLQAIPQNFSKPTPIGDPSAQFYVLKDDIALGNSEITNPQQSTDPNAGGPDVTFNFTSKGKAEFQHVTADIAHRGDLLSGVGQTLNQHFAVALDDQLITVPFIDFKQYPDGINGDNGADISGSFTITSAEHLANELRYGPLPVHLTATG